jgi:hypothetical protein
MKYTGVFDAVKRMLADEVRGKAATSCNYLQRFAVRMA